MGRFRRGKMPIPTYYQVSLKLFGTFQIIFFLMKFFEFFRIQEREYINCTGTPLLKAYNLILISNIGAAGFSALRAANFQAAYKMSFSVYDFETVSLLHKKCRSISIFHIFFAFCSILLMTPIIYNEYSCLLEDDINDQQQHCPGLSCSKDAQRDHFKIIYLIILESTYALSGFITLSMVNKYLTSEIMLEEWLNQRVPPSSDSESHHNIPVDAPPKYSDLFKGSDDNPPRYTTTDMID